MPGEKQSLFLNTDLSVFTFNSTDVVKSTFLCHLELEVKNSNYGFSVFIGKLYFHHKSVSHKFVKNCVLNFARTFIFVNFVYKPIKLVVCDYRGDKNNVDTSSLHGTGKMINLLDN